MDNFIFNNPTKIYFGKGQQGQVGSAVAAYSRKVLVHYGGGSIKKSGLYAQVLESLALAGVDVIELGGAKPNPRLSLVREGIQLCKEHDLGFILAVGGGSAIDSAKAIAVGVCYDGDVWDFYTGVSQPQIALPLGTILTIPAAGSESSNSSVITNEAGNFKRGLTSDCIYPQFSILNPEFTYTLPKYQVACGAADILAHLMERYFTNTQNVELIDRLIESTMKTVIHHIPKVLKQSDDYTSWAEVMWAGTIAHNNLLNTGRDGDWASHDIEHEISGIYDVAHGAGLAVVFTAWMKYVYKHDLNRFVQFASRVWDIEINVWNLEETALLGIQKYEQFMISIGMPTRLEGLGITDNRLTEMAKKCTNEDQKTIGNFVKLGEKDVYSILQLSQTNQ